MAQNQSTTAASAHEHTTLDAPEPCTVCGCLSEREYETHTECTRCGDITQKNPFEESSEPTTIEVTVPDSDETHTGTKDEIDSVIEQTSLEDF